MIVYILLNVKPGKEEEVLKKLQSLEEIKKYMKEVSIVYGEYDIILKLELDNINVLRNLVLDYIRKIEGVERTTTLISTDF